MTSNFLYLSCFTLHYSSLWRSDTIVFAKLNKPPIYIKPSPSNVFKISTPTLGGGGGLNRGLTVNVWSLNVHMKATEQHLSCLLSWTWYLWCTPLRLESLDKILPNKSTLDLEYLVLKWIVKPENIQFTVIPYCVLSSLTLSVMHRSTILQILSVTWVTLK